MNRQFKMLVISGSTCLVAMLLFGAMLGQGADTQSSDPYRHIHVYTEVFSRIKSDYVEEPDMKTVTLGAINGLLVSLDPFASYLNSDQYKQYLKSKESSRANVGLVLSRKYGAEVSVVDAIPGSPADKAGLTTGDIIEAINGVSTRDMPLAFAGLMLEGDAGTNVDLTVLRLRRPEPAKITLTRAVVNLPAVESKTIEGQVGYVKAAALDPARVKAVAKAVSELSRQGMQKLILDLRHASVGAPEDGVELAKLFLEKGRIGSLKGQKIAEQTFEADPSKVIFKGPMVVLTNRGMVGGSEVAASALIENKRASGVGERTYGDAALRKPVPTGDGGAILLAVAKYFNPGGKAIQEVAVTPTVAVLDAADDADGDDAASPGAQTAPATPRPAGEDAILKKALEILAKGLPADGKTAAAGMKPPAEPEKPLTPLGIPKPPGKSN